MQITAIILNYNNYDDLKKCIASLLEQSLPQNFTLNYLIIDNGSIDGSSQRIKEEFPRFNYIFNTKNLGFSKAVNQGMKKFYEKSDYFLLVNNDAKLDKDCIAKLLESKADISGPSIFYTNNPNVLWQSGGSYKIKKMNIEVPLKNKQLPVTIKNIEVEFLSGCVMLINKETIGKIGFFDESFFFYGEDVDFCLRAKKNNLKVIYVPYSYAWHNIQSISSSRTSPFVLSNLAKSYFLIIRKHHPLLLPYGIILFIFLYTPFRFYQIIEGCNNYNNIFSWLSGGMKGLTKKINIILD
ncbi:MAG: glycosyltransferase family 2 protein [Clostridia bacterium]|nr:glycosyltransferase family 2 protein [Clostridia bacterium]